MRIFPSFALASLLSIAACTPAASPPVSATSPTTATAGTTPGAAHPAGGAQIGSGAPAFTLKDLEGKSVSLGDFKGKTVVLEWFNPECPFVKMSHTKGSLVGTAKRAMDKGVVWLAINSSAPGKQGTGVEKNVEGKKRYDMPNAVLLDESGDIGHAYGATNTPHMFVIDPAGVLVYAGAIDNSPDGDGESPEGGKLVNYVEAALGELASGKPVTVKQTRAYGCSVKYAK